MMKILKKITPICFSVILVLHIIYFLISPSKPGLTDFFIDYLISSLIATLATSLVFWLKEKLFNN